MASGSGGGGSSFFASSFLGSGSGSGGGGGGGGLGFLGGLLLFLGHLQRLVGLLDDLGLLGRRHLDGLFRVLGGRHQLVGIGDVGDVDGDRLDRHHLMLGIGQHHQRRGEDRRVQARVMLRGFPSSSVLALGRAASLRLQAQARRTAAGQRLEPDLLEARTVDGAQHFGDRAIGCGEIAAHADFLLGIDAVERLELLGRAAPCVIGSSMR